MVIQWFWVNLEWFQIRTLELLGSSSSFNAHNQLENKRWVARAGGWVKRTHRAHVPGDGYAYRFGGVYTLVQIHSRAGKANEDT